MVESEGAGNGVQRRKDTLMTIKARNSTTPTVMLITGAAGAGKSTLLSGYLEGAGTDRTVLAYDEHRGLTRNTSAEIHSDGTDFLARLWGLLMRPDPLTIVVDGLGELQRQTQENQSVYVDILQAIRPGDMLIVADQQRIDPDPPSRTMQVQLRVNSGAQTEQERWLAVTYMGETTPYPVKVLRPGAETSPSDDLHRIIRSCLHP